MAKQASMDTTASAQARLDGSRNAFEVKQRALPSTKLHLISRLRPELLFERYGMRENPFGVTPDPRYLYPSRTHAEAKSSLIVGIECGIGFQALIGPPGMGKTTILFDVLERFNNVAHTAFLFQIHGDSRDFLRCLISELEDEEHDPDPVRIQDTINRLLIRERRAGKQTIIVIDEAQSLDNSVLETIRLLSNFETPSEKLVHIILAGQPTLMQRLSVPELTQLRQRIFILTTLMPFGLEDTRNYVEHRLRVAGYQGAPLFTPAALKLIAERSRGVPRDINKLCLNALLLARASEQTHIDSDILEEVVADLDLDPVQVDAGVLANDMRVKQTAGSPPTNRVVHPGQSLAGIDENRDVPFSAIGAKEAPAPRAPLGEPVNSGTTRPEAARIPKANLDITTSATSTEKHDGGNGPISAKLSGAVGKVSRLTRADGVAIALRDGQGVLCQASTGLAPAVGSHLPPDRGFTRECFETGKAVLCEDAEQDPRIRPSIARDLHLRSILAVPIRARGSVLGVILVFSSRASAFGIADITALQSVVDSLSLVFDPVSAQEKQSANRAPPRTTATAGPSVFQRLRAKKTAIRACIAFAAALFLLLILSFFAKPLPKLVTLRFGNLRQELSRITASNAGDENKVQTATREAPNASSSAEHPQVAPSSKAEKARTSSPAAPAVTQTQPGTLETEPHDGDALYTGSPVLVIEGAPAGAQIFVDDQLTASIGSGGQAKLSALAPGPHHLRLEHNGYRDYDEDVQLQAGKTSTVVAKLESLEPPNLSTSAKAPNFPVVPANSPSVRLIEPSVPDFELQRSVKGHSGWVTGVAFSVDGQRLASGSSDQTVKLWDVMSGSKLSTIASKLKEVHAVAFSPDGRWLAMENSASVVTLWDATTGQEIRTFPGNKPLAVLGSKWVYSIAFSPDSRWLASAVDDKTVRVWEVQTGRVVRDFVSSRRSVIYIAFSPNGHWLASGDDDVTLGIWDVSTGQKIRRLSGHTKPIYTVAFSPDGHRIASAGADRSIKLWDAATGREVQNLTGHSNFITSLAFSPYGRWLASGSWDNTIKIWDITTGKEVQTLTGRNHIYSIAFDSHGQWLASGRQDGKIELWRLGEGVHRSSLR